MDGEKYDINGVEEECSVIRKNLIKRLSEYITITYENPPILQEL